MSLKLFISLAAFVAATSAFAQSSTTSPSSPANGNTIDSQSRTDSTTRVPGSSDAQTVGAGSSNTSTTSNTGTAGSTDQGRTDLSPKEICQQFVQNAKDNKDLAQLDRWVLRGGPGMGKGWHHGRGGKGGMERGGKMADKQNWLKQELSSSECNSETIAGDHAFVVVKGKDRERMIPFLKQGNQWKFDMMGYHALYRMEDHQQPSSK